MLLVPTFLARSPIHGIGLFAAEAIPKGTLVWKYHEGIDRLISVGAYERLPNAARMFIDHYASLIRPDLYLLCGDDARFVNHNRNGNIACQSDAIDCDDLALRDIAAGEEITEDYHNFCIDWNPEHAAIRQLAERGSK